jgi:hypothetical protein
LEIAVAATKKTAGSATPVAKTPNKTPNNTTNKSPDNTPQSVPAKKAASPTTGKAPGPLTKKAATVPAPSASAKPTAPVAKPGKTKPASAADAAPVAANTSAGEAKKKPKLVRDSFTMPRADFDLIDQLKERALGFKQPVKKSELLRAGLHALQALPDAKLKATLAALTPLKAGRPKKGA